MKEKLEQANDLMTKINLIQDELENFTSYNHIEFHNTGQSTTRSVIEFVNNKNHFNVFKKIMATYDEEEELIKLGNKALCEIIAYLDNLKNKYINEFKQKYPCLVNEDN